MTPHQLRILHGVHNISGIPGALARAERAIGAQSAAVCYPNTYGFAADQMLSRGNPLQNLLDSATTYDIFNFHFGYGFFDQALGDFDYLKRIGKTLNLFFHGCDVRDSKKVISTYEFSACKECWPMACNANRKQMRAWAEANADRIFVSTPDLLEFFTRAIWLPQAVPVAALAQGAGEPPRKKRRGKPAVRPIRIAHAPSSPQLKGTRHIREAIEQLQSAGAPVELIELTGMSHANVMKSIAGSDMVIDQLLIGAYGVVTIEALALGKPTICYIRDDLRKHYGEDLPVISATVRNLKEVIVDLIGRRDEWPAISAASMSYAMRVHDEGAVARKLMSFYPPVSGNP